MDNVQEVCLLIIHRHKPSGFIHSCTVHLEGRERWWENNLKMKLGTGWVWQVVRTGNGWNWLSVLFDTATWYWRCWLHPRQKAMQKLRKTVRGGNTGIWRKSRGLFQRSKKPVRKRIVYGTKRNFWSPRSLRHLGHSVRSRWKTTWPSSLIMEVRWVEKDLQAEQWGQERHKAHHYTVSLLSAWKERNTNCSHGKYRCWAKFRNLLSAGWSLPKIWQFTQRNARRETPVNHTAGCRLERRVQRDSGVQAAS